MSASQTSLQIAAWLHLCQLPGILLINRHVIRFGAELEKLSPLAHAIVQVISLSVVALLVALGALLGVYADEVLHTRFGVALVGALGVFWLTRLGVQLWYYRSLSWPHTRPAIALHYLLVTIFATQALAYGAAVAQARDAAEIARRT